MSQHQHRTFGMRAIAPSPVSVIRGDACVQTGEVNAPRGLPHEKHFVSCFAPVQRVAMS